MAGFVANRDFLSVGHGARANAMGEAFVAVSDNSSAIYWNPAGLTQLREDEMAASYADRFDGLADETQLHYAWRGRSNMWGIGYAGSYVTDIPITQSLTAADINAINTGAFATTTHPTRKVLDHALLVSYARPFPNNDQHSMGATVKLIYRDILSMVRGYGTSIDLGYMFKSQSENWRFGTNLQNAASLVSFSGDIDNLGVRATSTESYLPNIKTGLAYSPPMRVLHGRLLLALDVNMLTDFDVENYNAGVEYAFGGNISIRGGKVFSRQEDSSDDYTLGLGVVLKALIVDFSFLTNELGDTIRGTIGYRMGGDYYTPSKYR